MLRIVAASGLKTFAAGKAIPFLSGRHDSCSLGKNDMLESQDVPRIEARYYVRDLPLSFKAEEEAQWMVVRYYKAKRMNEGQHRRSATV